MKKIEKMNYQGYTIYALPEYLVLGKQFLDKNYKTLEVYKDTKRNYVSKIDISGQGYVLKNPRSEQKLFQKKMLSIFKKPEVLSTLENVNFAIESYHFKELICPYVAIIKKDLFLKESYLIMEAVDGVPFKFVGDLEELVSWIIHFHKAGFYHKDFNTSNILVENGNLRVFDTQAKRESLSFFHRAYDILTLKQDLYVQEKKFPVEQYYPFPKGIGSSLAVFIKWIKYNPCYQYFRKKRHKKREP